MSEPDREDQTVAHVRHRSEPPSGPASESTRSDAGLIEPVDDLRGLVDEMRKPASERLEEQGLVASGGMGAVHVVLDRAIGRRMAMKTMHPMLREDDRMLRLFLREARTTGLLDHPNIVPVYDVGERDGALYFTMKLVSGRPLQDVVREHPSGVSDPNVLFNLLDVVVKMCDALAFAHSRGVVHCDIKPANVMLGEFGEVYLMDWGIARVRGTQPDRASYAPPSNDATPPSNQTGDAVLGTASYMSPEQAEGNRVLLDARSDVFSVGAVLYAILCGRPPYRGASYEETLSLARAAIYAPPSALVGEGHVAPELERIVMKAMSRHRSDRYEGASALKADVLRYMRGGAEFPQTTFPKGTVIIREGDPGNSAYIIASGQCVVRKKMGGVDQVLKTLGPGEVFGEMAVLTESGARTASVVATEETTALVVTRTVMQHELDTMKPWMARLLHTLAERFGDLYATKRVTLSGGPTAQRLANQLLMHLVTWGEHREDGSIRLQWSRLSREIEAQMGATPHTIHMVAAQYPGVALNLDQDEIVISDERAFRERIERELGAQAR